MNSLETAEAGMPNFSDFKTSPNKLFSENLHVAILKRVSSIQPLFGKFCAMALYLVHKEGVWPGFTNNKAYNKIVTLPTLTILFEGSI